MKIKDALSWGFQTLKEKNIGSYHVDTELILCFTIKKKKEWILSNSDFDLSPNQFKKFKKLILKRTTHYPIAYILGYKYFFGLKFKVNKHVLIPRPETELLVESTCEVANLEGHQPARSILDIGTGSGAIAVSLAKNLENTKIIANDNSSFTINMARKNARAHELNKKIKFVKSDLLDKFKNFQIDIIVANLPYVKNDWDHVSIKHEPYNALYSGKSGLVHYFKLLKQIKEYNINPKFLLIEISPEQVESISKKIKELFTSKTDIEIKKDLSGFDRVLIVKF